MNSRVTSHMNWESGALLCLLSPMRAVSPAATCVNDMLKEPAGWVSAPPAPPPGSSTRVLDRTSTRQRVALRMLQGLDCEVNVRCRSVKVVGARPLNRGEILDENRDDSQPHDAPPSLSRRDARRAVRSPDGLRAVRTAVGEAELRLPVL